MGNAAGTATADRSTLLMVETQSVVTIVGANRTATVAQSDKEAKRRIRAFLDHKIAKVKPK